MGPLAGLAAGLGLAALASHFGFGEGLANFMMIALLAFAVIAAIGFFMRKKAGAQAQGLQYASAGANYGAQSGQAPRPDFTPAGGSAFTPSTQGVETSSVSSIPADFDVEGFVRNAKVNFIRLQAANGRQFCLARRMAQQCSHTSGPSLQHRNGDDIVSCECAQRQASRLIKRLKSDRLLIVIDGELVISAEGVTDAAKKAVHAISFLKKAPAGVQWERGLAERLFHLHPGD